MERLRQIRSFVARELVDLGIPDGALSPEDMRRTRIISITALGLCTLAGIPCIVQFTRLGLRPVAALIALAIGVSLLNLLLLRAFRRPRLAAHVSMGILAWLFSSASIFTGGFYEPGFTWLYLLPLAAAALIDMRGAALWTTVAIGVTVAFWLLPHLGVELVNRVPEASRDTHALFTRVAVICAVGIIAGSFVAGQREAERRLATANDDLLTETAYVQLLMHAAVSANEAQSFESAMRDCMRRICETMHWTAGHIYLVRDDGTSESSDMGYARDASVDAVHPHLLRYRPEKGVGLVGRAVSEGRPQILNRLEPGDDPESGVAVAVRSGIRAAMAVPVFVSGNVPAVMLFASPAPLARTARLSELFSLIGIQLGKVAERAVLHERVQQTQKMEAVGQLAAGVAHEINNPMSYVRTNLQALREDWTVLRSKLRGQDEARLADFEDLIDESLEGVERTIAIVRDVKEFSHSGSVDAKEWQCIELSELCEGALRVVSSQVPPGVRIESTRRNESLCRCSANQIRQVLVNLLVNAIQAVGSSGNVWISTGLEGKQVFARIEDDGPGMDEHVRERLFEPFFTTKPVGEGTGLGLSVSYEIVRKHGGEIRVHSEPGAGACFEVRLPSGPEISSRA